jgi:ketosteroid isomerase-like protein
MSTTTYSELVLKAFELTDSHDLQAMTELMAPDCEFVTPAAALTGRTALLGYFEPLVVAFPDAHHTIPTVIVAGDTVVLEGTWSGTHTGVLATPQGALAPTGLVGTFPFAGICRVRQNLVESVHIYHDSRFFTEIAVEAQRRAHTLGRAVA